MSVSTSAPFKSKIAFIQGGARGIGAAIALKLAEQGAAVTFTYVNSDAKAQALVAALQSLGTRALAIKADSADADAVKNAILTVVNTWGNLDILVNNAGILTMAPIDSLSLEDFDRSFAVNVRSAFVASQVACQHMNEHGRIINIGSINAERVPFQGATAYAMSKSALVGLTKALAQDLAPRKITVNNVQPGPVNTDLNPDQGELAEGLKQMIALGRYGQASEIADFVSYLCSPSAGYITGASLNIDGGFSI